MLFRPSLPSPPTFPPTSHPSVFHPPIFTLILCFFSVSSGPFSAQTSMWLFLNSILTFSPRNLLLLNHLLSAHSFLDQTTSHVESRYRTKGPTYMIRRYLLDISWWHYLQEWTPVISLISIPMCSSSWICHFITCIPIRNITFPKVWIKSFLYMATGKLDQKSLLNLAFFSLP